MTNLLALDTSTRSTVLGLALGDEIHDHSTSDVDTHSRNVLPDIEQMIETAGVSLEDIDAIIFGQGPGSFTGLRIATGVVQGLAYGLGIPVVPVSSMACIARSCGTDGQSVFVALTARLEEVYYGAYRLEPGEAVPLVPEGVVDVSRLPQLPNGDWVAAGNALHEFRERIEAATGTAFVSASDQSVPDLAALILLGQHLLAAGHSVSALEAAPVYLREKVASRSAP